jgi:hypothetical protein
VQLTGWPHEAVHCTSNNKFSWKGALIKTQWTRARWPWNVILNTLHYWCVLVRASSW